MRSVRAAESASGQSPTPSDLPETHRVEHAARMQKPEPERELAGAVIVVAPPFVVVAKLITTACSASTSAGTSAASASRDVLTPGGSSFVVSFAGESSRRRVKAPYSTELIWASLRRRCGGCEVRTARPRHVQPARLMKVAQQGLARWAAAAQSHSSGMARPKAERRFSTRTHATRGPRAGIPSSRVGDDPPSGTATVGLAAARYAGQSPLTGKTCSTAGSYADGSVRVRHKHTDV
jgi:hypothetical protein